jgi:hypothetical protein
LTRGYITERLFSLVINRLLKAGLNHFLLKIQEKVGKLLKCVEIRDIPWKIAAKCKRRPVPWCKLQTIERPEICG